MANGVVITLALHVWINGWTNMNNDEKIGQLAGVFVVLCLFATIIGFVLHYTIG